MCEIFLDIFQLKNISYNLENISNIWYTILKKRLKYTSKVSKTYLECDENIKFYQNHKNLPRKWRIFLKKCLQIS